MMLQWLALGILVFGAVPATARDSDAVVKQAIVRQSLAHYRGNCPCPYSVDRAGRSCGRRSAYSRPGGQAPKCYASDVSPTDVMAYRAGHAD